MPSAETASRRAASRSARRRAWWASQSCLTSSIRSSMRRSSWLFAEVTSRLMRVMRRSESSRCLSTCDCRSTSRPPIVSDSLTGAGTTCSVVSVSISNSSATRRKNLRRRMLSSVVSECEAASESCAAASRSPRRAMLRSMIRLASLPSRSPCARRSSSRRLPLTSMDTVSSRAARTGSSDRMTVFFRESMQASESSTSSS